MVLSKMDTNTVNLLIFQSVTLALLIISEILAFTGTPHHGILQVLYDVFRKIASSLEKEKGEDQAPVVVVQAPVVSPDPIPPSS